MAPPAAPPPASWWGDSARVIAAGGAAGAAARTLVAPFDRVKLLAQIGGGYDPALRAACKPGPGGGALASARAIVAAEGFRGLFRGNSAALARTVPYSATQLSVHDALKSVLAGGGGGGDPGFARAVAAAAAAGCAAAAVSHPFDTLRLHMACETSTSTSTSLASAARAAVRERGVGALYRGLGPALAGAAPFSAVTLVTFDGVRGLLAARRKLGAPSSAFEAPAAGAVAGAAAATLTYPLDTLRRRQQVPGAPSLSALAAARALLASDGVVGFWRGWHVATAKLAPQMAARLGAYSALKRALGVGEGEKGR